MMSEFIYLAFDFNMTPHEAIEILKQYNAWRRDENIPNSQDMPDPKQIGIAIDTAVDFISELTNKTMTREEKISKIYEAMADRIVGENYKIFPNYVLIGDVLKYIDTHHCLIDVEEWHKSRDMEALDSMLRAVFYAFVGKQDRPIDEQDDSCIDFVYSLINN